MYHYVLCINAKLSCQLMAVTIQDAFILDTGAGGIFAWLGSGATQQEKKAAFKNAVVSSGYQRLWCGFLAIVHHSLHLLLGFHSTERLS